MTKRKLTKSILIAESEDDEVYTIETQQTPNGSRFRVTREFLERDKENITPADLWDSDPISFNEVTKRGKWFSSLEKAVASLPECWVEFLPEQVAHEFAAELWPMFLAASQQQQANAHACLHSSRWKTLLCGNEPDASQLEAVLDLAGESGGYGIQACLTPRGHLFRLKSSGLDWDPDTDEECWSSHLGPWRESLSEVFVDLNPSWYRLLPTAVHPGYATEIWQRYQAACSNDADHHPHLFRRWTELFQAFDSK